MGGGRGRKSEEETPGQTWLAVGEGDEARRVPTPSTGRTGGGRQAGRGVTKISGRAAHHPVEAVASPRGRPGAGGANGGA